MQALEAAIERGLPRVEAGAQGEHKLQRGYLPSLTYSSHYIRDGQLRGAVDRFLEYERGQIDHTLDVLMQHVSPYKDA
jgi:predicted N-acyltransferase